MSEDGLVRYMMEVDVDAQELTKTEKRYEAEVKQKESKFKALANKIKEKFLNPIKLYKAIAGGIANAYRPLLEKGINQVSIAEYAGIGQNLFAAAKDAYKSWKFLESSKILRKYMKGLKRYVDMAYKESLKMYQTEAVKQAIKEGHKLTASYIRAGENFKG